MKRLDPRTKIALLLGVSLLAITLDQWFSLTGLCVLALILFLLARPQLVHVRYAFLMAGLTTWGLVVSQGLFYQDFPRTVLFFLVPPCKIFGHHFSGLAVYRQGLYYGAIQSLRFNAAMFAGLAVCLSTSVEKLYFALLHLPIPRGVSFLSISALRFLPVVTEEFQNVRKALRLKGYRPFRRGLLETLRTELAVSLPVLSGAIRRARELADTLLTRGFDPLAESPAKLGSWSAVEKGAAGLFLGLCLVTALAKFLFWLYLQEILYVEGLRKLYTFCRQWL